MKLGRIDAKCSAPRAHAADFRNWRLQKIGFVTLDPPRVSDKLRILLQGFVWETCASDMKIVHKIYIRSERF